jgi:hypothetical protein
VAGPPRTRGARLSGHGSQTWCHSRDYGAIVANGFGPRVLPAAAGGKPVVKAGSALELAYGVLLLDAPSASPIDCAAEYKQFQSALGSRP